MKCKHYRKIKRITDYLDNRDKILMSVSLAALSALFASSAGAKKRKIISSVSVFLFIVSSMPVIGDITEAVLDDANVYSFADEDLPKK